MNDLQKYRPDIDGLRAVAVLLVVGYHAFPEVLTAGFTGVDVFFVISGFLITSTTMNDPGFSFAGFYARRFRRLLPALFTVLIATVGLSTLVLNNIDFRELGKHLAAGATFTSNLLLVQESGYFDLSSHHKPLLHLWSLGIEEQFYLLWPVILILFRKRIWLTIILLLSVSFASNIFQVSLDPVTAFYLLPSRFWELLAGCALAIYESKRTKEFNSQFQFLLSLAGGIIIGAGQFFVTSQSFPGWPALFPVVGTLLFIAAGPSGVLNRLLSNAIAVAIGRFSYPLYLWHWPLLCFRTILTERGIIEIRPEPVILLSACLAYLTWTKIEIPFQKFKFANLTVPKIRTLLKGGVAVGLVFVALGWGIWSKVLIQPASLRILASGVGILRPDESEQLRMGRCFIDPLKTQKFETECYLPAPAKGKKRVFLIGDSHAGFFYPGLKDLEKELPIQVLQLNAGACPPVFDLGEDFSLACRNINIFVHNELKKEKADLIVLYAVWKHYEDKQDFFSKLEASLKTLRDEGFQNVIVLGTPPDYGSLPDLVESNYLNKGLPVPVRSPLASLTGLAEIDLKMQKIISQNGFQYISMLGALCNREGCLLKVGDDLSRDLVSYDFAHFSVSGAKYIAHQNVSPVLSSLLTH